MPMMKPVREASGGRTSAVASIRFIIGGGGMSGICEERAGRAGIGRGTVLVCGGI